MKIQTDEPPLENRSLASFEEAREAPASRLLVKKCLSRSLAATPSHSGDRKGYILKKEQLTALLSLCGIHHFHLASPPNAGPVLAIQEFFATRLYAKMLGNYRAPSTQFLLQCLFFLG